MSGDNRWNPGHIINDVLFGRTEHLFLAEGAHQVLSHVTGATAISKEAVSNFAKNIRSRRELCQRLNISYRHIICPDKQTVLHDEFPFENALSMSRVFEQQVGTADDTIIYASNALSGHTGVFKRADTHLTDKGTILTTCHLIETLVGQDAQSIADVLLRDVRETKQWAGDLGGKIDPVIAFDESFYCGPHQTLWFHNSMGGGNNGITDLYFALNPKFNKRVLFFGDSFGREICRFLGILFQEVVFLRTPFLHEEMVHMIKPDIVISENVERYLDQTVLDDSRESFFMYPYLRDGDYRPGAKFAEAFSAVLSYSRAPYTNFVEALPKVG